MALQNTSCVLPYGSAKAVKIVPDNFYHIQCMAKDKRYISFGTEISKPVPAEDTFDPHNQVATIGTDQFQEPMRLSRDILVQTNFPFIVQDADVHHLGVQIDPAVILVRIGIESHSTTLLFVDVALDCPPKSSYSRGEVIISIKRVKLIAYCALSS